MCLIYIAWRCHPRHRLVVAANRDEFHARPAQPAHWWDDAPGVLAGRDLEAGGTWMGVTSGGRFAAITNYRGPSPYLPDAPSRGALVSGFLTSHDSAPGFLGHILEGGQRYNGFSLLAMDGETLAYASNRSQGVARLAPGVYGLSNHLLDTAWPKVTNGKRDLERLLAAPEVHVADLLALLSADDTPADKAPRTDTESDFERMHWRSLRFILGDDYGTRTSTVFRLDTEGGGVLLERSFDSRGMAVGDAEFELGIDGVSREIGRGSRLAGVPG